MAISGSRWERLASLWVFGWLKIGKAIFSFLQVGRGRVLAFGEHEPGLLSVL